MLCFYFIFFQFLQIMGFVGDGEMECEPVIWYVRARLARLD